MNRHEAPSWNEVRNKPGEGSFLLCFTEGENITIKKVPAMDITMPKDVRAYIAESNSPIVAFRWGAKGKCAVQVNSNLVNLEEVSVCEKKKGLPMDTIPEDEFYDLLSCDFLNKNKRTNVFMAKGLTTLNSQFMAKIVYLPSIKIG